jgi:hypothetical protein
MARFSTFPRGTGFQGLWANGGKGVKDRYLGFKFAIYGKTHYGWARLNVKVGYSDEVYINAALTGYAYETIPNKPIITRQDQRPGRCDCTPGLPRATGQRRLGSSGPAGATLKLLS